MDHHGLRFTRKYTDAELARFREFATTDPGLTIVHDAAKKIIALEVSHGLVMGWVESSVVFGVGIALGCALWWALGVLGVVQ